MVAAKREWRPRPRPGTTIFGMVPGPTGVGKKDRARDWGVYI